MTGKSCSCRLILVPSLVMRVAVLFLAQEGRAPLQMEIFFRNRSFCFSLRENRWEGRDLILCLRFLSYLQLKIMSAKVVYCGVAPPDPLQPLSDCAAVGPHAGGQVTASAMGWGHQRSKPVIPEHAGRLLLQLNEVSVNLNHWDPSAGSAVTAGSVCLALGYPGRRRQPPWAVSAPSRIPVQAAETMRTFLLWGLLLSFSG